MKKLLIIFMSLLVVLNVAWANSAMGEGEMLKIYDLGFKSMSQIVNNEDLNKILEGSDFLTFESSQEGKIIMSSSKAKVNPINTVLSDDGTLLYQNTILTKKEYELLLTGDIISKAFKEADINTTIVNYYWFNRTDTAIEAIVQTDLGLYWVHVTHITKCDNGTYNYEFQNAMVKPLREYIQEGKLFINGSEVEIQDKLVYHGLSLLMPLRSLMENLGADVVWNKDTSNISINYLNETYICEFVTPNPSYPNLKFITVKNENLTNGALGNYIQLSAMSGSGIYEMIDDRTYLYQDTGKRLLEALGCAVEIDLEQSTLKITNK